MESLKERWHSHDHNRATLDLYTGNKQFHGKLFKNGMSVDYEENLKRYFCANSGMIITVMKFFHELQRGDNSPEKPGKEEYINAIMQHALIYSVVLDKSGLEGTERSKIKEAMDIHKSLIYFVDKKVTLNFHHKLVQARYTLNNFMYQQKKISKEEYHEQKRVIKEESSIALAKLMAAQ